MRHTVLCLSIAFLAAIFSFVLIPIIFLALLRILTPGVFGDDTLGWILIFVGPQLLALLLTICIAVGLIAFVVAKAKLSDRGWRSRQTFVILLTSAATVAAAIAITWPFFMTTEPSEAGPQQTGLPSLHLARTLTAANVRSGGSWELTWSADGERLAAYGGAGIITWRPDGKYRKELPVLRGIPDVLRYLSGHRALIASPTAEIDQAWDELEDIAFSVLDAETGKVLQNIPGPHPGGGGPKNRAADLAVSPDERFVAVVCGSVEPQINIYSSDDRMRVATLDVHGGNKTNAFQLYRLAFSPDGKKLAVVNGSNGVIKLFEVGSWTLTGSPLVTFAESSPQMGAVGLGVVAFNPDGTLIAVGARSGGTSVTHPNAYLVWPGSGVLKVGFPADPLRVYRVSDGSLVASLGSFPGGFWRRGLAWSPNGEYLAFQDALGDVRFWNPFQPNLSVAVARKGAHYSNLLFSRDSSQLAVNFPDGVKVFDVVPPH
jgi:WD40 repeat protein